MPCKPFINASRSLFLGGRMGEVSPCFRDPKAHNDARYNRDTGSAERSALVNIFNPITVVTLLSCIFLPASIQRVRLLSKGREIPKLSCS